MEVILLEKVSKLGSLGTTVKVAPGFARNYLIPQGIAISATPANLERFKVSRAEFEQKAAKRLAESEARAEKLNGKQITIQAQTGEEGRLFGSVGTQDIARALKDEGIEVSRSEIKLPSGPIRLVGEYDIEIQLQGTELISTLKVSVQSA